MVQAAMALVHYFREVAPPMAEAHGIAYPAALERIALARLEQLVTHGPA
jgi:hypothetical protein